MGKKSKKKLSIFFKIIIAFFIIITIIAGLSLYKFYQIVYKPNISLGEKKSLYINIPTGSNYNDILHILYDNQVVINRATFEWLAQKKNYPKHVKPGRYFIDKQMGNNELIDLLRSGKQEPINIIFNNIRTKENLAARISQQIEADSLSIINLLYNNAFLEAYGFDSETILAMFLPNTYEFYWNTSAQTFIERMHKEYQRFWNEERQNKAAAIGLSPVEVGILASIVQSETHKKDEMARVAGVYVNRLKKGMLLQADPTVIYAWQDFTIKRVLFKHLEIDSPYNTYKYSGLPPGPITLPEPYTIEQVLNYEKHNYIFFCAKADFSGYHAFAKDLSAHNQNARKYQEALRQKGIK